MYVNIGEHDRHLLQDFFVNLLTAFVIFCYVMTLLDCRSIWMSDFWVIFVKYPRGIFREILFAMCIIVYKFL